MNVRTISAILFFALLVALLALTYYPDLPDVKVKVKGEWFRLDYIGHFGFYAAISSTFLMWRGGWRKNIPLRLAVISLIAGIAFGIFTEYSQRFIHGRSFNPMDMLYNCIGVIVGVGVVFAFWMRGGEEGKRGRRENDRTVGL